MNNIDPQIIASLIAALFSGVTAIIAIVINKRFKNQERLKQQLELAHKDVVFLLEVEKEYGELHKQIDGKTNKLNVRKTIREKGHSWSGQFVPSRMKNGQSQE